MALLKAHLNKAITSEIDRTLAIIGLLFTSVLTIWVVINAENMMWKVAAGLAVIACAGYLALYVPPAEWVFGKSGMVLFFAMALIGCFYMMGRRFGSKNSFVLAIGGAILTALGYLAPILNIWIIEERWYYFGQIMMAVPFAVAMVLILDDIVKNKYAKTILMTALPFVLSFVMVMSPDVNMDNRVFTPNTAVRFAFTESEQQAADTLVTLWDGEIGTDLRYGVVGITRHVDISEFLYRGDYSQCQGKLVIIREEIAKYVFSVERRVTRLHYNPYQALEEQGFARIYDCGSVTGFIKP